MTQQLSSPPVLETVTSRHQSPRTCHPVISAELVDGLTDVVVLAGSDRERAAVIWALVGHIVEAVVWFHGPESDDDDELPSLSRLSQAATDHLRSMIEHPPR